MTKSHLSLLAALLATTLTACAGNAVDKSTNAGQALAANPGTAPAVNKDQAPSSQSAQVAQPAAAAQPVTTGSGLVYQSLKEGTGASPKATNTVRVHYHGTLADGKVFDSSVQRGQPAEFRLNQVIPCWTEGVQMMKVGGKARLTCPPQIAYGARGAGGVIPPNATLTFEVELLDVK
jgi:FKBP-type peptidyl-prolyl cis-trans isomerase FkpA